jgi:exosome complex component RRP46
MINSSSLALLNAASIPMRGVVCAVAVGHLPGVGFVVDPSEDECAHINAGGCFAFMFAEGVGSGIESVWSSWQSRSGTFAEKDLTDARALAQAAAQGVYNAMKNSVSRMGTAEPFEQLSSSNIKFDEGRGAGIDVDEDDKMEIWYAFAVTVAAFQSLTIFYDFADPGCIMVDL